ncbi:MAG: aminotransferase class III-fold pyridoxal phosphate-dependent enzyme [Acidimicrobiaceae bacterium]|nr:aminotransferase class III-fold pyridoxal phosphate-dependent enzyme [Acidimicrobiaceae bacterium]
MDHFDRPKLANLLELERLAYVKRHETSRQLFERADHLFARVPMTWMNKWAGGFPLGFSQARGALITDLDGHELIDFALGDTGAMAGHSPAALVEAMQQRLGTHGGVTTMLTNEDAEWVAAEMTRRFGLSKWSFSLSATDANRWLLRLVRLATGRSKILVFSYSYHGSVDETFVVIDREGRSVSRPGNVAPAVDPTTTTRVVEFNDLEALERELAFGDVAAVLTEPAMTNIGIVLPQPGFLEGVRDACDRSGTLLILDETHTFSAGPGGCTQRYHLRPDAITIGKSLGGGVPCGAYGLSEDLAERVLVSVARGADIADVGGVGGTLAGNAMSLAAMRAVLGEVLTDEAFEAMEQLATSFASGVQATIDRYALPWSVNQLGARCEYRFANPAPRSGGESERSSDAQLEDFLHLYCVNRGVLITPFHNMALMCPATTIDHVEHHQSVFDEAVAVLTN